MFKRGDLVQVQGWGGKRGILRVWEVRLKGLLLTTEEGFKKLLAGEEAPNIGYPMSDIRGLVKEGEPPASEGKNPHAVALGRLGGLKGGKARASKLTAEQRKGIAKKAAGARWKKLKSVSS